MSREKVRMSPADVSNKWNKNLKAAVTDIVAGVGRVTESPGTAAVAKQEKMKANLITAIDDGTWANRLSAVTLGEWKDATQKKVRERLSGGVEGAMSKRRTFDTWLVGRLNGVLPEINAMPDLTLEDGIARVGTLLRHMAAERYKRG